MHRVLALAVVAVAATACKGESAHERARSQLASNVIPAPNRPSVTASQSASILTHHAIDSPEPSLRIGDQAPTLRVSSWLKGPPVSIEQGNVYVIENWATWCKPCIEQMPHLSALGAKYARRGPVVVAVNVEQDNLAGARDFVRDNQDSMRYSVAHDDSGAMDAEWIHKAALPGLPASFVVDRNGRLAWMGHPEALGPVVDKVVAGDWDYAAERARAQRARLAVLYSKRVVELLFTDADRAYELVSALLTTVLSDQPEYLSGLAYHIFAAPGVARRDLDLAYAAGYQACEVNGWTDPNAIETLSKIVEQQGKLAAAVALQRRAVSIAKGASRFSARLSRLTAR